ncbi:efflux RND transporter periplasmic adaptor subunit [Uliginosibacterium sp. H1]|uniref:efflux RND transporter periplasmic adaptor subunit n=1 Tax=Uliginosibacterium sp. H1 TaxID=3114757 RepID=UPI002E19AE74|nr:efflux RND transporter periplasmic adaptor subunit [Uliginosibacterium sp. H1]
MKRLLSRKLWIVLAVLLVLVVVVMLVVRGRPGPAPEAAPAQVVPEIAAVDLATVSDKPLSSSVPLTGLLKPVQQSQLTAEVEGRIQEVLVRAGQKVTKGQVLARMDTRDLESRAAEGRANLANARAQVDLAESTHRRNEQLLARNYISESGLDTSRSNLDAARQSLRAREAQLSLLQQAQGKAVVRSPFAGVVSERKVDPGQHVGVNAPMFSVVDLSVLEFEAKMPVTEVGSVRPGLNVTLNVDGIDDSFAGQVERISPVADEASRMIPLYVRVPNPQEVLKGGMVAQGRLALAESRKGLSLPLQAIREEGGRAYVLAVVGSKLERREVQLGLEDESGGQVEVRGGVAAGDRVVLASVGGVSAGQTIKLMP